jgi:peptidyl-prolyl cis-trans isomerase D
MAILSRIRQRGLLIGVVIAFALLAFVIQDFISKDGSSAGLKDVGSINGKDISFEDFRLKAGNLEKSQQGMTAIQAANKIWEQEVTLALLTDEFNKLGLRVGESHLLDFFKSDPNVAQNPMFQNAAGMFDVNKFKTYFQTNPEAAKMLQSREKDAELNAKYKLYNTLIKAAVYTTQSEAKFQYEKETNKVSFTYVAGLYSSIKDSDVKVSDDEILAYMKKNEKKYKQEQSREIQYVVIEEKPSDADLNEVKTKITNLLSGSVVYNAATKKNDTVAGFRTTKDAVAFVNANSDVPFDSSYVAKKDLPAIDADKLYNLAPGAVYGPYVFGGYYCISKSLGRKAGVNARASHILIGFEGSQAPNQKEKRTKAEAKAKAEAILAQVNANPNSFLMLAYQNSDDSSAQQGGDLGYINTNQMSQIKPLKDFIVSNNIGKIGIVETILGYHVVKITDKQDGIQLATVAQKIAPSEITASEIFNKASQFEMEASEGNFGEVVKKNKLNQEPIMSVTALEENLGSGLGNQRAIIRWAFENGTAVGDVKRFEVANIGHIVATVKSINDSGLLPVDKARVYVEPILKKQKKAAILTEKMTGDSLEAIAKTSGNTIKTENNLSLESPVLSGGVGQEPIVVGAALALAKNKISKPLEGATGIYVVKNTSTTKAAPIKDLKLYLTKVKQQNQADLNRVLFTLKESATIEDNRKDFGL